MTFPLGFLVAAERGSGFAGEGRSQVAWPCAGASASGFPGAAGTKELSGYRQPCPSADSGGEKRLFSESVTLFFWGALGPDSSRPALALVAQPAPPSGLHPEPATCSGHKNPLGPRPLDRR